MREDLEDMVELYSGMPPEGQKHWRERALPSVGFESEAERDEFLAALQQNEKQQPSAAPAGPGAARRSKADPHRTFSPGQRVKADLAGIMAGGVQFSDNVEAAYAVVDSQVSADPLIYKLRLLITFHGVSEVEVPADRIHPM